MGWQRDEITHSLTRTVDEKGKRLYRKCSAMVPRKNGKTELAAALCVHADRFI